MMRSKERICIYFTIFNSSENVISTTQTTSPQRFNVEPVESLLSTTDGQFTPGYSSLQTLYTAGVTEPTASPAAAAIPTNHYHPSFVVADDDDNHADNLDEEEMMEEEEVATLPPPATGRAVDYRPAYPFSQLLTPNSKGYSPSASAAAVRSRPAAASVFKSPGTTGQQRVVYPSYQASRIPSRAEIDKLSGKGTFSDRFTPAEGVASNTFKIKQNRKPSITRPIGQTSNKVSSFLSNQQDLYAFPPNINSRYPSPSDIKQAAPSDAITSYLPPPAGPLDSSNFVGPVSPDLLPTMKSPSNDEGKDANGSGYQYNPPKPDEANDGYQYNPPKADAMDDTDSGDDQAPPAAMDDGDSMDMAPAVDDHDHDHHDHHEIGAYVDGKEYPTPPPGYFEEHDHHSHHHPDIEFSHGPIFHDHHPHDYPDIVYDDFHDHHHIHHDHHPIPMTTEPPPPPAPEPRVKKYSYFYIGRKLWYIPLYFTVWFTFYVLWLILKSIARHKVNLPNHYVTRRSIDVAEHKEAREAIDQLTVQVMDGIEKFKLRYVG
ncbi:uncharacterized protein LOC129913726 [Episyrphus balteatus]|uniref:uncharacterized protein LOC129913726 n=1 Tax=Episyrphus balteatus TaxID=286459 RepID=UPI002486111D|nr:uncharacterized protein LOC129913726 [Episyrphus balteatus]